ncbi:MAG: hypothetical protein E7589_00370 [Ruminococcaceae bacterium]|nr:hypothetical protein [Oscillospiraceae bacterium]
MFLKDKYRRVHRAVVKAADKAVESGNGPRKNKALKVVKLAFVPLMVCLIAFAVYQGARHVTVGMNTLRTQEITDTSYVSLELHIFRDEHLIPADTGTLIRYASGDGEKLGVGDIIGEVYSTAGLTAEQLAERQKLLNSFISRLETLQESGVGTLADAQSTSAQIDKSYTGLLAAAEAGKMDVLDGYAKDMLENMEKYAVLTGSESSAGVTKEMLESSVAALLADAAPSHQLEVESGGYFYRDVDGYEGIFNYSSAMTMTADEFLAMKERVRAASGGTEGYFGKTVTSPEWFAAAYVSFAEAASFKIGSEYVMQISSNAYSEIRMELVRNVQDDDGVLLVFSSMTVPAEINLNRSISVRTVSDSVSGYRVPESALIKLKDDEGLEYDAVYVLEGNVVECRIVSIIREYNGYCIVKTEEQATADEELLGENTSPWDRLAQNDKIITSGSGLYEGKIVG